MNSSCRPELLFCFGKCRCGTVSIELKLPEPVSRYAPRSCDCSFCTRRDGSFLSDPAGHLTITATKPLAVVQQGHKVARMHLCGLCGDLISATVEMDGVLRGNVRVGLLDVASEFQPPVKISPQRLSAVEKTERWSALWMPVSIFQRTVPT